MAKKVIGGLLWVLLLAATVPAHAQSKGTGQTTKKIQCWTDENGQRACGDRVPPEYAKQERKTFDRQGRVVGTREREKTAEELAAEQKILDEAAAAKRAEEERAAYDRFLTDTYSSVKDLERARNERLATLDGRTTLARQSVETDGKSKAALQARIDAVIKAGRPPDLQQKQLRAVEKTLRDNKAAIEQMRKDREKVCADFGRDIVRYQELTMGSSAYAGGCPAPGSPVLASATVKPKPKPRPKAPAATTDKKTPVPPKTP